ncbi:YutD family protein [Enterococcus faecalis]
MTEKPTEKPTVKPTDDQKAGTFTEELTSVLEEIKEEPLKEKQRGEIVTVSNETDIQIGDRKYRLVQNHREAFDPQRLGERFSDVLSRYDFIVGDWGYEQLRLKGFFHNHNRKASPDQRIETLEDYLYEYCNFGCAYFVLERTSPFKEKNSNRKRRPKRNHNKPSAFIDEKKVPVKTAAKPVIRKRKENESKKNLHKRSTAEEKSDRSFTIRQREE